MYVALYLIAIVAANLSIAQFGANAAIFNAFVFIALDLTARDKLHEAWSGRGLLPKMTLLIGAGSALSYVLNADAGRVALASCVAFGAAASVDTLTYTLLGDKSYLLKVNGSNVIGAAVDSILFPALAFGLPLLFGVMVGQFVAKVLGGFIWSLVLNRQTWKFRLAR